MYKHSTQRFLILLVVFLVLVLGTSTTLAPAAGEPVEQNGREPGGAGSPQGQIGTQPSEEAPQAGTNAPSSAYEVEKIEEDWTMRDGVVLPVSICRPVAKSPGETFPVIINIHGWCLDRSMSEWATRDYAARGYIGVALTTRGWFGAGGQVGLMDPELDLKDISDVITIVSEDQRFPVLKDAKGPVVGVTGYSMGGCFSYLIAPRENPMPGDPGDPRVRAVVPMHGSFDLLFSIYPNGAWKMFWTTMLLSTAYMGNVSGFMFDLLNIAMDNSTDEGQKISKIMSYLFSLLNTPITQVSYRLPYIFGIALQRRMDEAEAAKQWAKPHSARYWCDESYDGIVEHPIIAPMLIVAGWQDDLFYANEGLMAYTSTDAPKRIIIDNHGHLGGMPGPYPVDLPSKPGYQWTLDQVNNWFDHFLKGIDNGAEEEPEVTFYRDRDPENFAEAVSYPLPGTEEVSYYLGENEGSGELSTGRPNGNGSQSDLFINIGITGSISLPYFQDATEIVGWDTMDIPKKIDFFDIPFTERDYVSDALSADLTIMGPPKLEYYYQSSDSFAQLIPWIYEVAPDGKETLISRGFFEGYNPEKWSINNNTANPLEMQACYHRFPAGSRIKLELTTADIPGEWPILGFALVFLYHDKEMASRLMLPVVPNTY